jgi:hypothetical protein
VDGIVETGYLQRDILGFSVPYLGSWDRQRFVPEASKCFLVVCGLQPSPEPPALRYSSTRSVPQLRPREQFSPDIHYRGGAPWDFSLVTSRLKQRLRSALLFGDEPGTLESVGAK